MKWKLLTSTLGLLTHSLICPHNGLVSHLKLVNGFLTCFIAFYFEGVVPELVGEVAHDPEGAHRVHQALDPHTS